MISSFTLILANVYGAIALLTLGLGFWGQPALARMSSPLWLTQEDSPNDALEEAQKYNQQGIELMRLGDYAEAVDAFQQALEIYPNSEKIYSNLGIALGHNSRFEEAVEAFQEALKINPQNWETYNNLGIALGSQEKYDQALAAFQEAINLNPNAPMSYHNSAVAYIKQEQWEEAIISLEAAQERYANLGQTEVVELIDRVLSDLRDKLEE
ncbi:tetratricopeptide repeat protein [Roseofilum sp. BLCC_M154]|uniref:Tetratricopeptide repeat protein n=1 Tax=Roseofilum acuticapitatum BLCC-M154 TaxID=3022444 RepID=A0ABT7AMW5_9CYAN|nr:tetratricopeptide repeat protein [Roseofilum acuticapitatum]MDJ1168238.1 tetratricopeptide repeat protein [Roseofilum acuticapitatum BLCC-M154]